MFSPTAVSPIMGRPSLTIRSTRSTTEDSSTDYPRRFPRIGGGFQCRGVPDLGAPAAERPAPLKMNESVPFFTDDEVNSGLIDEKLSKYGSEFVRLSACGLACVEKCLVGCYRRRRFLKGR